MTTQDLDPIATSQAINDSYRRYLRSTFAPRKDELHRDFEAALAAFKLAKGPFLQASPPYETGVSLQGLVDEGVLANGFNRLTSVFPPTRPLYTHQEESIRKLVGGRNLMVATGTGSGKTECFLFPILQHLLQEADGRTLASPGVRALLLYPMNALANDQVKRLRELFEPFPEITFGRYIGDTKKTRAEALDHYRQRFGTTPLSNELISREEMQARPPHVLLTNYAMLEYLLLRPADSSFFDGETGRHWRFLVLDEIHVYDGAKGAELGMLLRRLKDRVHRSEPGRLRCIGTSATLGSGPDALVSLTQFGETIFGERFEFTPHEPMAQDVVRPRKRPLAAEESHFHFPVAAFDELRSAVRAGNVAEVSAVAGRNAGGIPVANADEEIGAYLYRLLVHEEHVVAVQRELEAGSKDLTTLAVTVFGTAEHAPAVVAMIDLGIKARPSEYDSPLIPARYHLMVRALEGAFVCGSPEHPSSVERMVLARHKECPTCADQGRAVPMFELGVCRRCGADYLIGSLDDGHLLQASAVDWDLLYLLIDEPIEGEDEDEAAVEGEHAESVDRRHLCTHCGSLSEQPMLGCCDSPATVSVVVTKPAAGSNDLRRCLACAGRSNASIVYRFLTGADAPVSVIATSLYQSLPESSQPHLRAKVGGGRKLLSFADSRQDAAFFAPYLDRTYGRAVERRLIWQLVSRGDEEDRMVDDLVLPIRKAAERSLVLDPEESGHKNSAAVRKWLMREVLATDRRQGLEGVGLAEVTVALPRGFTSPPPLSRLGFSDQEAGDLCRVLLDTLRTSAAVHLPEDVDVKDPTFAPRNVVTVAREKGSEYGVLSWLPGKGSNRRLEFVNKVFERRAIQADATELLSGLWGWFTDRNGPWARVITPINHKRHGTVFALSHERIQFVPASDDHPAFRCDTCRQVWWRSVSGACPSYKCVGTLEHLQIRDPGSDHYRSLYTDLEPIGMRVEEHTGQLTSDYAGELQEGFIRGDVNVLSCSTTFELGVDVGEVQAVLMRNVPPRPSNYVQRAGRAGRRLGAAALVVTFAQRRNHDLHYFDEPYDLIDGVVASPIVTIDNIPIVRRHVHAVAFAAFERRVVGQGGIPHHEVKDFFEPNSGAPVEDFLHWLSSHPSDLGQALARIVPAAVSEDVGIGDWSWATRLSEGADEGYGWLGRAAEEVRGDLSQIRALIEKAKEEDQLGYGYALQEMFKTLARRPLIEYLAQRVVLPKYGFPVDVVSLDVQQPGDRESSRLELQRDLRTAIVEYAPGSRLVANKAIWEPTGLRKPPGRAILKRQWNTCSQCHAFATWFGERSEGCPRCGDQGVNAVRGHSFIQPIFGFIGKRSDEKPGESRPPRGGYADSYFDEYEGSEPEFVDVVLGDHLPAVVHVRASRQGRITAINKGRGGGGFRVCRSCGAAKEGGPIAKGVPKPHKRPFNTKLDCNGAFEYTNLGHLYLTDVVEIALPSDMSPYGPLGWSVLYAILTGARAVGVAPSDIDGTLRITGAGLATLVLFDAVPGGAGHALHLARHLPQTLRAAYDVVANCECGPETSCYSCLRSYSNQQRHNELVRGVAQAALGELLGLDRGPIGKDGTVHVTEGTS